MNLRKCTVDGKDAYFHKWNILQGVTLGLVELEDGSMAEVSPQDIIFTEKPGEENIKKAR